MSTAVNAQKTGLFDPSSVAITGGTARGILIDGIPTGFSQSMPKWRKALAGVRAKTAYAKIACVGDSETYGNMATGTNANIVAANYPTRLSEILNANIPAIAASFFGDGSWGAGSINSADPRITPGAWAGNGPNSVGGASWTATSAATFAFAPGVAIDTVDVWSFSNTGLGSFSVNVDGGATLATVSENAAAAAFKTTVSTTLATHTINAVWASGSAFFFGMDAYSSATKSVRVLNMGRGSAASSYWNTPNAPFDPASALQVVAPDLTIIMLGVNDWQTSVSVGTYMTNMQALITAAKVSGDVLLVSPLPTNPANSPFVPNATQQGFVQACYALAASNNVPLLDMNYRFGGSFSAGSQWYSSDGIHPLGIGYSDMALAVAKSIL
jgi:hypothetical protein